MKKINVFLALALVLCLLAACGETAVKSSAPVQSQPVPQTSAEVSEPAEPAEPESLRVLGLEMTNSYINDSEDGTWLFSSTYPAVSLADEFSSEFSKLYVALDKYSGELDKRMQADHGEMLALAQSMKAEASWFETFSNDVSLDVRRADEKCVSFLESWDIYTGGVHGNQYYKGVNFNSETGEALALTDVIPDISTLPEVLAGALRAKYPGGQFDNIESVLEQSYMADNGGDFSWTLGYQGVTFYFSPYELASYAEGLITADITFAANPELFNDEYTEIPENVALSFGIWQSFYYDLDGDGTPECIEVDGEPGINDAYETAVINVGDKSLSGEIYAYRLYPYLLHLSDGRDYIYLDSTSDNDYRTIYVYDISGGEISFVGSVFGEGVFGDVLTDPTHFMLDARINVLSTYSGRRYYGVGADGMPEAQSEWYNIFSGITLTSKKELEVGVLDAATTTVKENAVISAGEQFELLRTDNKSFVDAALPDGREVRISVSGVGEWPIRINGADAEEYFDGMMYAG